MRHNNLYEFLETKILSKNYFPMMQWHYQLQQKLKSAPSDLQDAKEQSAVSLILKANEETGDPEILFIKRAERQDDPWSGHMAFPGGRRHLEDQTIIQTAVRETYEEIGMQFHAHETLGCLEAYSPRVSPELSIYPYIFFTQNREKLKLNPKEVEEVHWVAVEQAFNPASFTQRPYTFREMNLTLPSFSFLQRHIWGVTYVIFLDFLFILSLTEWGQQLCRERNFDPRQTWKYHPYR